MNTCEPTVVRNRPAPPVSFRARGCVLTDEPPVEIPEIVVKPDLNALKLKEQAERESIRRAALVTPSPRRVRGQAEGC